MQRSKMSSFRLPAGICETETRPRVIMSSRKYFPIWQISLSRLKEFVRAPGAVFWVYGFPIIMMLSLGTAFRDNPKEVIPIEVVPGGKHSAGTPEANAVSAIREKLARDKRIRVK